MRMRDFPAFSYRYSLPFAQFFPRETVKTALNPVSIVAARAFAFLVLIASIPVWAEAQRPSVISAEPEDSLRTTIKRSTHPLARPEYDAGAVDPGRALERL